MTTSEVPNYKWVPFEDEQDPDDNFGLIIVGNFYHQGSDFRGAFVYDERAQGAGFSWALSWDLDDSLRGQDEYETADQAIDACAQALLEHLSQHPETPDTVRLEWAARSVRENGPCAEVRYTEPDGRYIRRIAAYVLADHILGVEP